MFLVVLCCDELRFRYLSITPTRAKDLFHQSVKTALTKEGWIITSDPLTIRLGRVKLGRVFAAEKDGQQIAIEVKSFINPSNINDFHAALGQFLNLSSCSPIY